ncbi:response regulator [Candidatus Kuenenbacteria bacterium]|nr:response regulator [Candidatus Kuenenbacteria bacterium]
MAPKSSPKNILIVDDEKPIANALCIKLKKEGFNAEVVSNGEEALSKITTGHFDLIFLDLMMPKVSGFEVLEVLKSRKNKIPVIVSSNLSQAEDIGKAKSLGAVDYFVKSDTTLSEAVAKVKKFLDNK